MNEQQILNRCKEFTKLYFNEEFNEKIRISGRMTTSFASVRFKRIFIDNKTSYSIEELVFARNIFQNSHYSEEELDKIIKHELVHFYLLKYKRMDCGHNAHFKQICLSIGGDLGYANCQIKQKTERYVVVCSCCGKVIATRAQKPTFKLMADKISRCCNASLFNMGRIDLGISSYDEIQLNYLSQYKKNILKKY